MSRALYRKYRPCTLAEVVGQEHITNILAESIKQGKISHAYLFVGPRGTGKTSVARIFAHEINHFKYELEDNYLDIIEIDAASNTGVDNIRDLREKAIIAPTEGKYKVYIIDEVHMLSKSAFNALLKTLEEPPAHVVFIMATTDVYKVPVTITSRAQMYTFKLADDDTMFKHLQDVAQKEKIKIDDEALKIIVRRGGGSFRDSLSLLDQISTIKNDLITAQDITTALGLPQDKIITDLLTAYAAADINSITATVKEALNTGVRPETLASEIISYIIANPKPEYLKLLDKLPDVSSPFAEAKLLTAILPQTQSIAVQTTKVDTITTKKIEPEKAPQTITTTAVSTETVVAKPAPESSSESFNWDEFVSTIKGENLAIYSQISNNAHEFKDNTLYIYPKGIAYKILSRDNNKAVIQKILGSITLVIQEESKIRQKEPTKYQEVSAIMGGNIQEVDDNGEIPF